MQDTKSNEDTQIKINSKASSDCPGDTWVYIWRMTAQKVGHTAIQVGGCTPKRNENDKGEYISIHPNRIPSVGPTIALPLPAGLASTLTEDMAAEAAAQQQDPIDEITTHFPPRQVPTSLAPDYTFKIPKLNTDAMRKVITTTRDEVETGQTTYQLLPRIDTLTFFREIPQYLNYNPIDITKTPPRAGISYGETQYNCATLVSTLLDAGGMPITQSKTPWGQTPSALAEQLSRKLS